MISQQLSKGTREVRSSRSLVLLPKMEQRLSDFVCETVRLSPLWEAGRGKYNLDDNPFWRDILDAMMDPQVREITVMKSTRVGGTLLLISALLGLSELDPAPAMMVTPDEPSKIELRDRTYDTAMESRFYAHRIPPERLRNNRVVDLGTCHVFLAQAGSAQSLRGRTCRRVFRSETDVYPAAIRGGGDPIQASGERVKRSFYSLIYSESSPASDMSTISRLHGQGNQMIWQCPCPHCGLFQELRFFVFREGPYAGKGGVVGYLDKHGNIRTVDEARARGHYICLNGCRVDNDKKRWMVKNGVWVPKGCRVDGSSGKVVGAPEKSRRHISCHLWSVHVPRINFAELAGAYADHYQQNKQREWFQNWLGRRYRSGAKPPRWDILGRRHEGYHERGQIPVGVWFLTAGVDVQMHGVYWTVVGWGHMSRCWLIDWGYCRRYFGSSDELDDDAVEDLTFRNVASDLKQLNTAILSRNFSTFAGKKTPFGNTEMKVLSVGIDAQYRKNAVHRYVVQSGDKRIRAVRGDHQVLSKDRWRKSIVEKDRTGQAYSQTREVWGISTDHYKTDIFDRFSSEPASEQSISFPLGMSRMGQDWLRQVCNERQSEVTDTKTGKKKLMWVEESNRLGSHYLDDMVYAAFCADHRLDRLGLTWDSNTWRNRRTVQQPQQQIVRTYQKTV